MSLQESKTPSFSALGRRAAPPTIARLMSMALETPGLLSLAAGFTDNGTLPSEIVAEAVAKITRDASDREFLQYGTNQGRPGLRRQLAARLAAQEPGLKESELAAGMMITNGSQQGLYLAVQTLCDPGDIVLVDRPSYFVFLEMLTGLGVEARSIPVDADGRVDAVELGHLLDRMRDSGDIERLRAVYFVSYFSNPSARSLTQEEKNSIARALTDRCLSLPVLEDAAYRELYFDTPVPTRSVLSLEAYSALPRLYLSTLTKPFATGLKVGYGVCTDDGWLKKMLHVKGHHDFGTANFNQAVFENVLATSGFEAQLARIRPAYAEKMRALNNALETGELRKLGWRWETPAGGLYLWLKAPEYLDTRLEADFCRACLQHGVVFVPGDLCFGDSPARNFARLSFGVLPPAALAEAGRRFVATAREFATRG